MLDYAVFSAMNGIAIQLGRSSLTSEKYRLDVLECLYSLGNHPGPIVELGCCHGGFSCLLARAAMETNRALYIVDISADMLAEALDTVERVNKEVDDSGEGSSSPIGFCGTFLDFAVKNEGMIDPAMIIIDAWHDFYAVYEDICVANVFYPDAKCICFHDYALRTRALPNNAVDKAFHFIYGKNASFEYLGDPSPGIINTTEYDAYYGIKGWPEGVAIWRNAISRKARDVSISYFEHEIRPVLGDKWASIETAIKRCRRRN